MPAKSKKTADKEKKKIIEDKTFGLKNKNKSAKVQKFISDVTQNVKQGNPNERKKQGEYDAKKKSKEEKKAFEEEMKKLFNDVDKPKKKGEQDGDDPEDVDKNAGVDPEDYLWTADDFEEVEEDNRRLEEQLEAEREALKGRTDLTPVTEESFQAWKAQKRKEAADAEKNRLKKAKESGKLRGFDLWEHDKDLFVDDEDADEFYEREEEEEFYEEEEEA